MCLRSTDPRIQIGLWSAIALVGEVLSTPCHPEEKVMAGKVLSQVLMWAPSPSVSQPAGPQHSDLRRDHSTQV